MKAVLVDDEYYALQGLKMELDDIGGIDVVGMYEDGKDLIRDIHHLQFDVLFLDIEMPGMNGFELFERLLEIGSTPNIIFVTAYSQHAVQAFEIDAVDYIVKPLARARLQKALDRIQPVPAISATERLEIKCFRHFSVMYSGKLINSGWRTRKAEELLAYLLCEQGRFVSKEKIADALWPDLDGQKGAANLYLAYYYIKKQEKAKGVKIPVESERGKMRLCLDQAVCDLVQFEQLVHASSQSSASERVRLLEQAVSLYRGALFEDAYYPWAAEYQQKYEIVFESLVNDLIDHYRRQTNAEKLKMYEDRLRHMS